ncbi:MAG: hypothetical protein ABIK89_16905 [Planctomycetota bacterium]
MTDETVAAVFAEPSASHATDGRARASRRRSTRNLLGCAVAAAALLAASPGCEVMSSPPRRPIDGLRMTGHEQPSPVRATDGQQDRQGELKRLDLRV